MDNKIHALVQKLIERTNQGKVNWEPTANAGTFQAAFPSYSVHIFKHKNFDYDQTEDYFITLHDQEGEMIDEISDNQLKDTGFENAYQRVAHLYNEARRKAMGVNQVIDDLLSQLGD